MSRILVLLSWPLVLAHAVHAATPSQPILHVTRSVRPGNIPGDIIVGRSRCRDETWLLTSGPDLITVSTGRATVTAHRVSGLAREDNPWGLACLQDGTVWTLATPWTLVRLDGGDARALERIALTLPRVALFAAADRLLFQQTPFVAATAALVTSPPREPAAVRNWPGLVQRQRAWYGPDMARKAVARNLVNCGIGNGDEVPCWFVDDARVVISNGRSARTIDAKPPLGWGRIAASLHDAALSAHVLWFALSGEDPNNGRVAGGTLVFVDQSSSERQSLDLRPAARLLLASTDTTCTLLTVDGTLMEVSLAR